MQKQYGKVKHFPIFLDYSIQASTEEEDDGKLFIN